MTGEILRSTIKQLFTVVPHRSTPTELAFICPEPSCGDVTGNRSANLRTGKTSCWRCSIGGDFTRWARHLGYVIEDTKPLGGSLDDLDLTNYVPPSDPIPPALDIPLPTGFIRCEEKAKSVYTQLIGEMAVAKNLLLEDLFEAGVGYTMENTLWEPYAIFPVTEYGRNVYYQGRTYVDIPGQSTKRFPSRTEVKYGSKYWVYNIDEIKALKPSTVIVVESVLNVLSLRWLLREKGIKDVVAVAVFKHYVSKPQASKLLAHKCIKELCLLYDHDASRSSWDKAPMLSDKVNLTIAEMPPGENNAKNDPNDDVHAAFAAFEKRCKFDAVTKMLRRLSEEKLAPDRPSAIPYKEEYTGLRPLDIALEQVAIAERYRRDDLELDI